MRLISSRCLMAAIIACTTVVSRRGVRPLQIRVGLEFVGAFCATFQLAGFHVFAYPQRNFVYGAVLQNIPIPKDVLGRSELFRSLLRHSLETQLVCQLFLMRREPGLVSLVGRAYRRPIVGVLLDCTTHGEKSKEKNPRRETITHGCLLHDGFGTRGPKLVSNSICS